jgi:hypothetical protein
MVIRDVHFGSGFKKFKRFRVKRVRFRVQGSRGSGFRVQGSRGSGFRVQEVQVPVVCVVCVVCGLWLEL